MVDTQRFVDLRRPRRIWAIAAIHGEVERLAAVHDGLGQRFRPGDRLVYLGNIVGRGLQVGDTIDEVLYFRRALLSLPGMLAGDIVFLRGAQEEMWQKLLQIQLAPNPRDVLDWMLRQGVDRTLEAYGSSGDQARAMVREGVRGLTRWTNSLRGAVRERPGHEALFSALRRAAFTGTPRESAMNGEPATGVLLVSAGFDPERSFEAQGDCFWWGGAQFLRIAQPYGGIGRFVRGFDPARGGIQVGEYTTTLDGGCGLGGKLVCACLSPSGEIQEMIEA
ncbi:Metallophosphoesterase [Azospirillaceae bacterium]